MNKQEVERALEWAKVFLEHEKYAKATYEDTCGTGDLTEDERKELYEDMDSSISLFATITEALAHQLTNGWIPVSEGLPSFNDVCDITRNGVVIEDVIYQGINDGEDTWLVHSSSGDYKYIPVYSAIAWRNHIIPEPYKEVSHG